MGKRTAIAIIAMLLLNLVVTIVSRLPLCDGLGLRLPAVSVYD